MGQGTRILYEVDKAIVSQAHDAAGNKTLDWCQAQPGADAVKCAANATAAQVCTDIALLPLSIWLVPEALYDGPSEFAGGAKQAWNGVQSGNSTQVGYGTARMCGVVGMYAGVAAGGMRAVGIKGAVPYTPKAAAVPTQLSFAFMEDLPKQAVPVVADPAPPVRAPVPFPSPRYALGIAPEVGARLTKSLRLSLDIKGRNLAIAESVIDGQRQLLAGVSGKASPPGTVPTPTTPRFVTRASGAMTRALDSEVKVLEHLAGTLKKDSRGVVSIYTERPACSSCAGVIKQFEAEFPGVKVILTEGTGPRL